MNELICRVCNKSVYIVRVERPQVVVMGRWINKAGTKLAAIHADEVKGQQRVSGNRRTAWELRRRLEDACKGRMERAA